MTQDEIRAIALEVEGMMQDQWDLTSQDWAVAFATRFLAAITQKAEPVAVMVRGHAYPYKTDNGFHDLPNGTLIYTETAPLGTVAQPTKVASALDGSLQTSLAGAAPLPDEVAQMVERLRDPVEMKLLPIYTGERAANLIERLARERDGWIDSAKEFCNGMEYYRGLIDEAAKHIGIDMYTADDQGVHPEPLRAKLPECVERLARQVPEGCVVVPRKVTEEAKCVLATPGNYRTYQDQWTALIAAGEVKL